jgi:hypothetical protein
MFYTPLQQIFKHKFTVKNYGTCKGGQTKFITLLNDNECKTRLATFFSYLDNDNFTDYQAKKCYIPVENYVTDNVIKVYGTTFELQKRISLKGNSYLAVLYNKRKIGIYDALKRVITLNNICIIKDRVDEVRKV